MEFPGDKCTRRLAFSTVAPRYVHHLGVDRTLVVASSWYSFVPLGPSVAGM